MGNDTEPKDARSNSSIASVSDVELPPVIGLFGPTASGKTELALRLAQRFPVEIVSVDSALVYRHMDIGTAKPEPAVRATIPHHLIDLIDPTERYSAARFCADARKCMDDIRARGKIPLLTGGTMLYVKALRGGLAPLPSADAPTRARIEATANVKGWPALHDELTQLDPITASRLDRHDAQRIQRALEVIYLAGAPLSLLLAQTRSEFPYRLIGCALLPADRSVLHRRIAARFAGMLRSGLIEELRELRQRYALAPELPSMRCVGYRQVWQYLDGKFGPDELREKSLAATRQLAKRQLTWLRALPDLQPFDCLSDDLPRQLGDWIARQLNQ